MLTCLYHVIELLEILRNAFLKVVKFKKQSYIFKNDSSSLSFDEKWIKKRWKMIIEELGTYLNLIS